MSAWPAVRRTSNAAATGSLPFDCAGHHQPGGAERQAAVAERAPRHGQSTQRARVVRRVTIEERRFVQLTQDPLRVEGADARALRPSRLKECVRKTSGVVAERDRVPDSRSPPEVLRRDPNRRRRSRPPRGCSDRRRRAGGCGHRSEAEGRSIPAAGEMDLPIRSADRSSPGGDVAFCG